MQGDSLVTRLAAALASSLTYLLFCSLVSVNGPLLLVTAGLSAASPGLSSLFTALGIGLSLYLGGSFKLLLVFLPILFLSVYKGLQGWAAALFVQLVSLLVFLGGGLAAVFLGLLYALASAEEPREAAATGLVFITNVFVLSGFLLPGDTWLLGVVKVPGGLASLLSATPFEVVNAGQFYLVMLEKFIQDPFIAASYAVLVASAFTSSLLAEELGRVRSSIVAPLFLSALALYSGRTPLLELSKQMLLIIAASGLASLATAAELRTPKRAGLRAKPLHGREGRETKTSILFKDLKPYVAQLRDECLKGRYRNVVVLGLSLEDEKAFVRTILGNARCLSNVVLFHERGGIPQSFKPEDTLVFYIPPLSLEEAVALLSEISGYPVDIIESVDSKILRVLMYMDRSSLLKVSMTADALISGGSSAKRAFEKALSEIKPCFTPEMASLIEGIAASYTVIGFKRNALGISFS